jgi:maleate isomerase
MTSDHALSAVRSLNLADTEALVISGTGMPTLRALRILGDELPIPVISSNLCLAWALMHTAAPDLAPPRPQALLAV